MNIIVLSHFTILIADISLITLLLSKNSRALLNRLGALVIAAFAIWTFGYMCMNFTQSHQMASFWVKFGGIGWTIFPASALYFYLALTNQMRLLRNPIQIGLTLTLTGFFLYQLWTGNLVIGVSQTAHWRYGIWANSITSYLFYFYYFMISVICITLTYDFGRKAKNIREKKQARVQIITSIISLFLASISNVVLPVFGLNIIPQIGDIFIAIWEFAIAISVIKYGLMSLTPVTASDQILSTMTDSLILLDTNGNVKLANRATKEMLSVSDYDINGTYFDTLLVEKQAVKSFLDDTLKNGRSINHEFTYISKRGQTYPVQVSASSILDQFQTTLGFVVVARDISERKKMEERLISLYKKEKAQREELQEEAKARGLFIDVLAHELRTPLTPMLASAGMLNDLIETQPEGVLKKLSANIYFSARTLYGRLEELLDLARYSRGTFKLNIKPVDFNKYLEDVIYRFKPSLDSLKQDLVITIPDKMPAVEIDQSRLEQVIINLLSNASKYGPDNSPILLNVNIENENLLVQVQDFGIGISQEEQTRLFQPYHRAEQDRQKYPGIGLGLAVCKQIIEAHHGQIWVTSQEDAGSTFCFRVPIKSNHS